MTRDEIIRMAQEAGFIGKWEPGHKEYIVFAVDVDYEIIESCFEYLANTAYQSGRNAGLKEAAEVCECPEPECCNRPGSECCGSPDPRQKTVDECIAAIRAKIGNEIMGGGDE